MYIYETHEKYHVIYDIIWENSMNITFITVWKQLVIENIYVPIQVEFSYGLHCNLYDLT